MYAFGECGPAMSSYVTEGKFPAIVNALHETDIGRHPHAQVVLAYFEVAARYIKQCSTASVCKLVTTMLGESGLRHSSDTHLRTRTAYLLLKVVEGLQGQAALLLPVVGSFSGEHIEQYRERVRSLHVTLPLIERCSSLIPVVKRRSNFGNTDLLASGTLFSIMLSNGVVR